MRARIVWFMMLGFAGAIAGGCTAQTPLPTLSATSTIAPSKTPIPTATYTLTSTDTPEPTSTATPTNEPTPALGETLEVPVGGFSFQPLIGYDTDVDGASVGVFDKDGTIIISLFGVTNYDRNQTPEEIIDEFLDELVERGVLEFNKGDVSTISVDGIEGMAIELTGRMAGSLFEGRTIVVIPSEHQFLYGLAIANTAEDRTRWRNEGSKVLSTLLETIRFIEGYEVSESACPVSADDTYGYSEDNPVKVGGDWLEGPARERAYLESLSGPSGEIITYERIGSFPHEDIILDKYIISYAGIPEVVFLYLDEYNYEELLAPVDFICWKPILLSAP